MKNIVFGGAGPLIWHLCAHDNPFTNNFDFSQFPSLIQFWFWNANQGGALMVTNAPNLASVQVHDNHFTSADFHGSAYLGDLEIANNGLTNLDINGCGTASNEVLFAADYNDLPQSVVDAVLTSCQQLEMQSHHPNSSVQVAGTNSAVPGVIGWTAFHYLTNNPQFWTVYATPFPNGTPEISNVASVPASNSATITWTTDIPSDSTVYYGTTTAYGSSNYVATLTTNHSVTLTPLTTNTPYHYYAASTTNGLTGVSWDYEFTTLGAPAIYFVSSSLAVNMYYSNSVSTTLKWNWGDGSSDTVTQQFGTIVHDFASTGPYTNYVAASSSQTLSAFGVGCLEGTTLLSVWGLNNFPQLEDAFFYESGLTNISLAGCSNLVHIALAACNPDTNTLNQWFIDLANAQGSMPPGQCAYCDHQLHSFFYTTSTNAQLTTDSLSARNKLTGFTTPWNLVGVAQ